MIQLMMAEYHLAGLASGSGIDRASSHCCAWYSSGAKHNCPFIPAKYVNGAFFSQRMLFKRGWAPKFKQTATTWAAEFIMCQCLRSGTEWDSQIKPTWDKYQLTGSPLNSRPTSADICACVSACFSTYAGGSYSVNHFKVWGQYFRPTPVKRIKTQG